MVFWKRILVGDFGPSLSAFPTPVSTLIGRALPWTVGLLTVSTLLAWMLGNLLGGLAGYYRDSRILKIPAWSRWACSRSPTTSWPSCC